MTDKNYKDALAERLTQVNVAATEWAEKMQPYSDEAVEHLRPRIEMLASLIQMMPEAEALTALAPNAQGALLALFWVARAAFIMGYCSPLVESGEAEYAITEAGRALFGDGNQIA